MEFRISYFKEALKEPVNIGGLLLSAAAAAYSATTGFIEPTLVLAGALVMEGVYLATVPTSSFYRRVVDRRSRHLLEEHRRKQREEMIKTFDPREREAVKVVAIAPACSAPCTAPAAPPSDCISATSGTTPQRLVFPRLAHSSQSSAIGELGVIG